MTWQLHNTCHCFELQENMATPTNGLFCTIGRTGLTSPPRVLDSSYIIQLTGVCTVIFILWCELANYTPMSVGVVLKNYKDYTVSYSTYDHRYYQCL